MFTPCQCLICCLSGLYLSRSSPKAHIKQSQEPEALRSPFKVVSSCSLSQPPFVNADDFVFLGGGRLCTQDALHCDSRSPGTRAKSNKSRRTRQSPHRVPQSPTESLSCPQSHTWPRSGSQNPMESGEATECHGDHKELRGITWNYRGRTELHGATRNYRRTTDIEATFRGRSIKPCAELSESI